VCLRRALLRGNIDLSEALAAHARVVDLGDAPHQLTDRVRDPRRAGLDLGPDASTLCEGWITADLAAHLVLRGHWHPNPGWVAIVEGE